jgi:rubrerythrin
VESAAALKELEIRKSEEAAAHLKQMQSGATREQLILQAALSQQQEQGSRDQHALQAALNSLQQEVEAGHLECQLCLVRGDKFKCFGCGHVACEICAPPLVGGPCPFCRKPIESQIEMFF